MVLQVIFCGVAVILTLTSYAGGELIDDTSGSLKYMDLDSEFRIYQKKLTWQDSLEFCSKCFGSFATFETKAEAEKLQYLLYNLSHFNKDYDNKKEQNEWGLDRRYWFGLTDSKEEGSWVWMKKPTDPGTPAVAITNFPWYPRQPDHATSGRAEHCGGFWNPGFYIDTWKIGDPEGRQESHSFNDYECDHQYYFICKKTGDADAETDESCTATASPPVDDTIPRGNDDPLEGILDGLDTTVAPDGEGTTAAPEGDGTEVVAPDVTSTDVDEVASDPTDPMAEILGPDGVPADGGTVHADGGTVPADGGTVPADGGTVPAGTDPATPTDPVADGTPPDAAPAAKRSLTTTKSNPATKKPVTKDSGKRAANGASVLTLLTPPAPAKRSNKPVAVAAAASASKITKPKLFKRDGETKNTAEIHELVSNVVSAEE